MGRDLLLRAARFLLLNSGEPFLLLLPALEEIGLRLATPNVAPLISDIERQEVLSTFQSIHCCKATNGPPCKDLLECRSGSSKSLLVTIKQLCETRRGEKAQTGMWNIESIGT